MRCAACGQLIQRSNNMSLRNHQRVCGGAERDTEDALEDLPDEEGSVDLADEEGYAFREEPTPEVHGLDNFNHLNQFLSTGRCVCTDAEMQLIKFVHMAHGGYGVSRNFSEGMLEYCKESGGRNFHLPDSWKRCVRDTTKLIESLEGPRKTFSLDIAIPQNVRDMLADPSQECITFEFECPIQEMIRVAMFTKTCKNWQNVALSYEDNEGYLDDFCNGERYKRIAADLSPGGAILGAVLATDGICLDKCMFDSQEVNGGRTGL